jgi:hypothetical protein
MGLPDIHAAGILYNQAESGQLRGGKSNPYHALTSSPNRKTEFRSIRRGCQTSAGNCINVISLFIFMQAIITCHSGCTNGRARMKCSPNKMPNCCSVKRGLGSMIERQFGLPIVRAGIWAEGRLCAWSQPCFVGGCKFKPTIVIFISSRRLLCLIFCL